MFTIGFAVPGFECFSVYLLGISFTLPYWLYKVLNCQVGVYLVLSLVGVQRSRFPVSTLNWRLLCMHCVLFRLGDRVGLSFPGSVLVCVSSDA